MIIIVIIVEEVTHFIFSSFILCRLSNIVTNNTFYFVNSLAVRNIINLFVYIMYSLLQ